jgi:hypothetical protein
VPGQAAEPWAVWFAAAEAELVPIDQAVPGPDSAEEGWDVRVALGPVLKSLAAWFVALEVAAFDPGLLEAAAETVSVWFVQGALGLVFAEGRAARVAPGQVLELLAVRFAAFQADAVPGRLEAAAEAELVRIVRAALVQVSATQVSVSQALFVQAFFAPSPAAEAPV